MSNTSESAGIASLERMVSIYGYAGVRVSTAIDHAQTVIDTEGVYGGKKGDKYILIPFEPTDVHGDYDPRYGRVLGHEVAHVVLGHNTKSASAYEKAKNEFAAEAFDKAFWGPYGLVPGPVPGSSPSQN